MIISEMKYYFDILVIVYEQFGQWEFAGCRYIDDHKMSRVIITAWLNKSNTSDGLPLSKMVLTAT